MCKRQELLAERRGITIKPTPLEARNIKLQECRRASIMKAKAERPKKPKVQKQGKPASDQKPDKGLAKGARKPQFVLSSLSK